MTDLIDRLAGLASDAPVATLRGQRAEAKLNAQKSYEALFEPGSPGGVSLIERHAVAAFVAGLHRDAATLAFYRGGLGDRADLAGAIDQEIERGAASGPYGRYPEGPLSVEDKAGPSFRLSDSNRETLGPRLAAALGHAHLLVFHPRDATPAALEALRDAGCRRLIS